MGIIRVSGMLSPCYFFGCWRECYLWMSLTDSLSLEFISCTFFLKKILDATLSIGNQYKRIVRISHWINEEEAVLYRPRALLPKDPSGSVSRLYISFLCPITLYIYAVLLTVVTRFVSSFFSTDMLQDQIQEQDELLQAQLRPFSDASQR